MLQRKLKIIMSALVAGGTALSLHAQMAQDPLLSRTASVPPNIVLMFDDSGSMQRDAIYQYGGQAGGMGMTGPGAGTSNNTLTTAPYVIESPDVNLMYYDPRVSYSKRVNADGTFQAPGSTTGISSFNVYFYKATTAYGVQSVGVNSQGTGYPSSGVTATFSNAPLGGVTATGTVNTATTQTAASVTVNSPGSGYATSGVRATFSAPPAGGTTATGTVTTGPSQRVNSVAVPFRGSNYPASGVTATFSPPSAAGGFTATGNVVVASTPNIASVSVTNGGSGYAVSGVTATFSAPAAAEGVTATGTVTTALGVGSVAINSGGSGYGTATTVTFSAPPAGGVTAQGTVTRSNAAGGRRIATFTITNPGSGYASPPTVTLSNTGGGSGATFTVNLVSTISAITITNGGSGYTNNPTVTLGNTGGGTGATFTITKGTTNWITGITLTSGGSGYTSTPSVTLGGTGAGSGAAFTVATAATNIVTGINITNPGSGYTTAPTISLGSTGGGSGATFTVNTGTTNVISGITITNAGSGYAKAPTMTLSNTGTGAGATFTVNTVGVPINPAINRTWTGTDTPTALSNYFNPSYTPDAGSPLAAGASAQVYPNTADSSKALYPKFRDRTDCDATACTWAQELQNYANWKKYHSTRLELAKTGLGLAFQPLNPTFRLGWGTINNLEASSQLDSGVQLYNSTTQSEFLTWLYGLSAPGNTPNRIALDKVGQYFQRGDDDGPWATTPPKSVPAPVSSPASANSAHASCRRSYALLMTDGYYNESFSLPDVDSVSATPITQDGSYTYQPIGPFSDTAGGTARSNTFADVAMKYWVNDLRPDLNNKVKTVPSDEAYWQHLNFYAIGLGITGTLDSADPDVLRKLSGNLSTPPYRSLDWPTPTGSNPTSIDDMWHATVNGHGRLLNAKSASDLNTAVSQVMGDASGNEGTQSGVAVSTASLTRGTKKYTPSYTTLTWNGNLTAYSLDPASANQTGIAWQVEKEVSTDPITGVKTYSSIIPLDNATTGFSRNIYVGNGATSGVRAVPFKYADMSSAGLLSQMTGTVTPNLINYLRGDPSNEDTSAASASPTAIYRERRTRLGDIINSTPVFVKDTLDLNYQLLPSTVAGQSTYRNFVDGSGTVASGGKKQRAEGMLFVGANDGMLHGFRDGTYDAAGAVAIPGGIETFAYVPQALLPTLNQLADKTYVHRYFVDGPNIETDAYFTSGTPRWANVVLGTTGGGAGVPGVPGTSPRTAVYAIDVTSLNTSPTALNASNVLWEISSTDPNFSELGYVLTDVQAGPTLDGSWVAIFGNGYESKSCQARLYVVNVQTGALVKEINTNAGTCGTGKNGLGGVRLVRNANQQVIGVYAGDLLGNLWKFNLNNSSSAAWGIDLGGSPLFTGGATQPITATPAVVALTSATAATIPAGGYMVVAGSGKFFEAGDVTNVDQQSLYGIWDPLPFGAATIPSGTALGSTSMLVQQTIGGPQIGGNNNTYFAISTNEVDYIGKTTPTVIPPKRGWYINLPNSGQRLVYPLDLLSGRIAVADTIAPTNVSSDPCANVNGGTGYLYLVDALTGAGPTVAVLDTNGDGNIGVGDLIVSGLQGSADGRNVSLLGEKTASKTTYFNVGGGSPGGTKIEIPCIWTNTCVAPPASGIKSREWRQLFMR